MTDSQSLSPFHKQTSEWLLHCRPSVALCEPGGFCVCPSQSKWNNVNTVSAGDITKAWCGPIMDYALHASSVAVVISTREIQCSIIILKPTPIDRWIQLFSYLDVKVDWTYLSGLKSARLPSSCLFSRRPPSSFPEPFLFSTSALRVLFFAFLFIAISFISAGFSSVLSSYSLVVVMSCSLHSQSISV